MIAIIGITFIILATIILCVAKSIKRFCGEIYDFDWWECLGCLIIATPIDIILITLFLSLLKYLS